MLIQVVTLTNEVRWAIILSWLHGCAPFIPRVWCGCRPHIFRPPTTQRLLPARLLG